VIEPLLSKSRQAPSTADRDIQNGDADAAANRCYYAVYYAAWAMFAAHGLDKPKTHGGLIAEFGKRFVKAGPLDRELGATLGKLESLRSYADYTLEPTPLEKARHGLEAAKIFLAAVEAEVRRGKPVSGDPR